MRLTISVIVCAYNEGRFLSACLHSLLAQTRPPDEIIVINNASTDETGAVARAIPGIRVIDEPARAWSWRAKPAAATPRATCSPSSTPTAARRSAGSSGSSGVSWPGARRRDRTVPLLRLGLERPRADSRLRSGRRAADPPLVHHGFGAGAILYGGNFAVRREALERIGGFDRTIEFHGEDTNLGRRLTALGSSASPASAGSGPRRAAIRRWGSGRCSASTSGTSGPRSCAIGRRTITISTSGPDVPGYEPFLLCDFHVHTRGATAGCRFAKWSISTERPAASM